MKADTRTGFSAACRVLFGSYFGSCDAPDLRAAALDSDPDWRVGFARARELQRSAERSVAAPARPLQGFGTARATPSPPCSALRGPRPYLWLSVCR